MEYNFSMDRLDALKSIAAQAIRGELSFPTNVDATLRLQQALNDPECHADMAARLVQAEPLLAARTVAIANSVTYNRSGNDVTNVRAAVQRVGFRTLGALAASRHRAPAEQRNHRSRPARQAPMPCGATRPTWPRWRR
jgi:HD-like signal output (HDOD) protein